MGEFTTSLSVVVTPRIQQALVIGFSLADETLVTQLDPILVSPAVTQMAAIGLNLDGTVDTNFGTNGDMSIPNSNGVGLQDMMFDSNTGMTIMAATGTPTGNNLSSQGLRVTDMQNDLGTTSMVVVQTNAVVVSTDLTNNTNCINWVRTMDSGPVSGGKAVSIDSTGVYIGSIVTSSDQTKTSMVSKFSPNAGTYLFSLMNNSGEDDIGEGISVDKKRNVFSGGFTDGKLGEQQFSDIDGFITKYIPNTKQKIARALLGILNYHINSNC